MGDRAKPSWRDLLASLGHRPYVCWTASFLPFVALAAVAFFQYSQALFYRFDGSFILTHATIQRRWMAPGFDLSAAGSGGRLLRANVNQAGLLFSGRTEVELRYRFSPWHFRCRF